MSQLVECEKCGVTYDPRVEWLRGIRKKYVTSMSNSLDDWHVVGEVKLGDCPVCASTVQS